jgi:hypothetical protein
MCPPAHGPDGGLGDLAEKGLYHDPNPQDDDCSDGETTPLIAGESKEPSVVFSDYSKHRKPALLPPEPLQNFSSADDDAERLKHKGAEVEKGLSVWDGTVETFSTVMHNGLLALPYAYSQAGLFAAVLLVFFVSCSAFTAHLMSWALLAIAPEADRRGIKASMRGWGFLMEVAFGQMGRRLIEIFLILEIWGYSLGCMVCMSIMLHLIMPMVDPEIMVTFAAVMALALQAVPTRIITRLNVASNLAFFVVMGMFIATGFLLPHMAPAGDVHLIRPQGVLAACGILVYSPASHSFYPTIQARMKDPTKYTTCIRRAYVAACLVYLVCSVPGYLLFGSALQTTAVENIGKDLRLMPVPQLQWMHTAAALCIVYKMLCMQFLCLQPLAATVQGALADLCSESLLKATVRPGILAVTSVVALRFTKDFACLLKLVGSVFCMNIVFVVPVLCYWRLASEPVGCMAKLVFVTFVMMGFSVAILGVICLQ